VTLVVTVVTVVTAVQLPAMCSWSQCYDFW
jgi:hypothetical protein